MGVGVWGGVLRPLGGWVKGLGPPALLCLWLGRGGSAAWGPGMHWKGADLRGGPRSDYTGGWCGPPKRLGAVCVGYCRSQMPLQIALGVSGTVAGRPGGGVPPPLPMHPCWDPPPFSGSVGPPLCWRPLPLQIASFGFVLPCSLASTAVGVEHPLQMRTRPNARTAKVNNTKNG